MPKKLTIEHFKTLANELGGECLSDEYDLIQDILEWKCGNCSKIWKAPAISVQYNKTWCRCQEPRNKSWITIEYINKEIEDRGICLSSDYINNHSKLLWKCFGCGHEWKAIWKDIKRGNWLCMCSIQKQPDISELKAHAVEKEGKLISTLYKNAITKMIWECNKGHQWKATWHQLKSQDTWCPRCNVWIREELCREFFETLFDTTFPKKRPKWLINPKTKSRLELDGYNKVLKLAFEHQGRQHYEQVKRFGNLEDIQYRDQIKRDICKQRGVKLIEIPYWIPKNEFEKYIKEQLNDDDL